MRIGGECGPGAVAGVTDGGTAGTCLDVGIRMRAGLTIVMAGTGVVHARGEVTVNAHAHTPSPRREKPADTCFADALAPDEGLGEMTVFLPNGAATAADREDVCTLTFDTDGDMPMRPDQTVPVQREAAALRHVMTVDEPTVDPRGVALEGGDQDSQAIGEEVRPPVCDHLHEGTRRGP